MFWVWSVVGLAAGSFANAAIWRIKVHKPMAVDRSMCTHCKHKLSGLDLVPVISWLMLGGKCRYCKQPISIQYPLLELVTAGLFTLSYLAWDFSNTLSYVQFGFWLVFLTGLLVLAVYDFKWMLLPDRMLKPLILLALVQVAFALTFSGWGQVHLWQLLAAALAAGFFYALHAFSGGKWMGGGDVKLAFLMGLLLTPADLLVALVLAFNAAALISLVLIASRKLTKKSLIPFGPFLIGATILAQLYGQDLINFYLRLVTIY